MNSEMTLDALILLATSKRCVNQLSEVHFMMNKINRGTAEFQRGARER